MIWNRATVTGSFVNSNHYLSFPFQQPPEESGLGQRGPPPPSVLTPQHHLPPQGPHPPQPQQPQQAPAQSLPHHHVGLNGGVGFPSPLPSPLPNGPSTSSGIMQGGGGIGNPAIMSETVGGVKGVNHPPMGGGPGLNGAAGDDASSGYGSPDSLTLEDRWEGVGRGRKKPRTWTLLVQRGAGYKRHPELTLEECWMSFRHPQTPFLFGRGDLQSC